MTNTPPEATFRLGNVNATVWSNESLTESGNKMFRTVQLEQRYKDANGNWQSSNRFTLDQLLRLRVCLDKAIALVSEPEKEV